MVMNSTFFFRRRTLAIVIAGLFGLTLAACGDAQKSPGMGAGPGGMPPAEVDVISVASGSSSLTEDLPGRLQAVRTAQVRARVEGIVEKRLFVEGSDVKQGDTLFLIDDRNYKAAELSARVDVAVMKNALDRYQPLLPSKAVSQQEYDQAQVKLMQTETAHMRAKIDLENTRVPAPISGHIGRTEVTEGALVGKGEATLMATIEQINPIYANFTQSNSELLHLQHAIKTGKLKRAEQGRVEMGIGHRGVSGDCQKAFTEKPQKRPVDKRWQGPTHRVCECNFVCTIAAYRDQDIRGPICRPRSPSLLRGTGNKNMNQNRLYRLL